MGIMSSLKMAVNSIFANKLRTFLTMLGEPSSINISCDNDYYYEIDKPRSENLLRVLWKPVSLLIAHDSWKESGIICIDE